MKDVPAEKGKNIPLDAVKPLPNSVVLPGGSYDFAELEKALEKAADNTDEVQRQVDINKVLVDQQKNEARSAIAVPPGHEIAEVEDAQGNKVMAPVPIIEKGEAVDPETVNPPPPAPQVVQPGADAPNGATSKDGATKS